MNIAVTVMTTLLITVIVLSAAACRRQPAMSTAHFVHLPSVGWMASAPLSFSPEYSDSTAAYDLLLAVRHTSAYRYSNLALVVDFMADDASIHRKTIDLKLADQYGNWTGGGFGALYQATVPLASGLSPSRARKVTVWQSMAGCDTLQGLVDVGIITHPVY